MQAFIFNRISLRRTARILRFVIVFMILSAVSGCEKEHEPALRPYPRLNTLEVTQIDESGAVLNAEITSGNLSDVIEYGFVWNKTETPALDTGDLLKLPLPMDGHTFSAEIHTALVKGATYYVKPWLRTSSLLVYGRAVSFTSMGSTGPEITGFTPKTGFGGDTIQVTGKYLWSKNEEVSVNMGGLKASVVSMSYSAIKILVPENTSGTSARLGISIIGKTVYSADEFLYRKP